PRQSPLWASVKASCTLPGILPLVELEGRHLGDGGMVNNIPSDILRESGCDLIVSFNITPELGANKFNPKSLMGVLSQTLDIAVEKGGEGHLLHADLEVQPSVAGFGTADFSGGYRLMELGAEAMEKKLGQLRRLLDRLHSQTAY
ncbi:MAG: hypothetical protein KDK37_09390, partial [Leptospiraceae bacterium]|nr:hypothetical protein [Leptospiraceae bacterium]